MKNMKRLLLVALLIALFTIVLAVSVSAEVEEYKLYVGGVQVTSENAADILKDKTVSYDKETSTLTLNGASITDCFSYDMGGESQCVGILSELESITINLIGENKIDLLEHSESHEGNIGSTCIYSAGDLFIKGEGALSLIGEYGATAQKNVNVNNATLYSGGFFGISVLTGNMTFVDATIIGLPTEKRFGGLIFGQSANIELENTIIEGSDIESAAIYTMLGNITIKNSKITTDNMGMASIAAGNAMEGSGSSSQVILIKDSELDLGSDMIGIMSGGIIKMENVEGSFKLNSDVAYAMMAGSKTEIVESKLDIYAVAINDGAMGISAETVKLKNSQIDMTFGGMDGCIGIASDNEINIDSCKITLNGTGNSCIGIYSAKDNINITDSDIYMKIVGSESDAICAGLHTEKGVLTVTGGTLEIDLSAHSSNEMAACIYSLVDLSPKLIDTYVFLKGNKVSSHAFDLSGYISEYEITASKYIDGSDSEEYNKDNISKYQYFLIHSYYEVSFDPNGLEGTMESVSDVYGSFQLPECTFIIPEDMYFGGWALTKDGEIISDPEIIVNKNITLYPICKAFADIGGGEGSEGEGGNGEGGEGSGEGQDPGQNPGLDPDHTHEFSEDYKYDSQKHWKACICGERIIESDHVDNNQNGSCDICGGSIGSADDGANVGVIIGVVVGVTVALGGGGFALWWFVFKKKRK